MVSYTRGDSPDAAERLRVLEAYAGQAAATTAFNTSLQVWYGVLPQYLPAGVTYYYERGPVCHRHSCKPKLLKEESLETARSNLVCRFSLGRQPH